MTAKQIHFNCRLENHFRADDDIMEDPEEEGRNKTSSVRGHHDAEAPSQKKQKTEKSPSANALDNLVKKLEADESFEALDVEEGDVEPVLSTFRGRKYPTRGDGTAASNNTPDLLLYTLTHEDRYNGAATKLRGALKSEPLLVHGLSGAGKTRALLDVLANNNGEQGSWEYGVYIDLGNMASGQLPKKNFRQTDVNWMSGKLVRDVEEGVASNTRARHFVQCLVLARAVLLHVLKKKGWVGCHLLYAQLGTGCGGEKLLEYARTLFFSLLKWEIDDIGDPFAKINPSMLVVIDEANVALQSSFGSFKGTTKENKNSGRPLLSPLYEVLRGTKSVFAGTNMSFGNVLSTVVSQMAEEGSPPPFNHFTSLISASQMGSLASKYFGLNRNMEDASILKGRCRFFMLAIYVWLTNPSMAFVDAITKAAARLQNVRDENSPHASVYRFVEKHQANRAVLNRITDDLLTSFIEGKESALVYEPIEKNIREDNLIVNEVVDTSIATTAPGTYKLALKEPVVVFGLISALGGLRIWDPADSIIKKMCQNQNQNPSMMGFMFEYLIACLLIPNFSAVMQHLAGQEEFSAIPDWVLQLSRSSNTHFVATNSHYRDFAKVVQMETVCFPPSKPSGPDILAWLQAGLQADAQQALMSAQCKLYQHPLTNALTKAAVATLNKSGQSSVRILFTGNGAEGAAGVKVAGKTVTITLKINDIVDLPAVAKIGVVYRNKYGESLKYNLEEYEADNFEDDDDADDAEEEEGGEAVEAQAMGPDDLLAQDGISDGDKKPAAK